MKYAEASTTYKVLKTFTGSSRQPEMLTRMTDRNGRRMRQIVMYTYDLNGNITSLTRMGDDGVDTGRLIDDLSLSYSGNQLTKVTEFADPVFSEATSPPGKIIYVPTDSYQLSHGIDWFQNVTLPDYE